MQERGYLDAQRYGDGRFKCCARMTIWSFVGRQLPVGKKQCPLIFCLGTDDTNASGMHSFSCVICISRISWQSPGDSTLAGTPSLDLDRHQDADLHPVYSRNDHMRMDIDLCGDPISIPGRSIRLVGFPGYKAGVCTSSGAGSKCGHWAKRPIYRRALENGYARYEGRLT